LRVRRAVALLLVFLVLGTATGAFAAVISEAACEDCGEGDDGCCPPVCPECICVARSAAADVPQILGLPGLVGSAGPGHIDEPTAPASADPREILHIPKRAG
jgi:hypothetical protein